MKKILLTVALGAALVGCSGEHDYSGSYYAATGPDCTTDEKSSVKGIELITLIKSEQDGPNAYNARVSTMKTLSLESAEANETNGMNFNFYEQRPNSPFDNSENSTSTSLSLTQHPTIKGNLLVTNWSLDMVFNGQKKSGSKRKLSEELGNDPETGFCIKRRELPE
jgi:hypothetical protein